jgi:methanogenic corrinoid protein MtbC1
MRAQMSASSTKGISSMAQHAVLETGPRGSVVGDILASLTDVDASKSVMDCIVEELALTARERAGGRVGDGDIGLFVSLALDVTTARCETFARRVAHKHGAQELAKRLLAPAAGLLGDYWRRDICNFLVMTAAMERIERIFRGVIAENPPLGRRGHGRSILLSPVPGEQHGFGLAVVEDAFRRAGWHVDRCSFDEEGRLVTLASQRHYDAIGLSIGGEAMMGRLGRVVEDLRRLSNNRDVRIGLGGPLVALRPELTSHIDSDFSATDAALAVDRA